MRIKKTHFQSIILCLAALCMAWGLKCHYSIAHAEHLKWILAPTAALVEAITGHLFYFETDTGYINHDLQIIIAPVCAGVNFLITAFSMSFFCGIFKLSGFKSKCFWLVGCAAGAYIVTINVNALRIWIAIALITADIHAGWFTPQRVHRMSGILIYFFFLCVFYHIIQKIIRYIQAGFPDKPKINISRTVPIDIFPLVCYWIIAISVPWLNAAHKKNAAGFIEHSLTVGVLSFAVFVIFSLIRAMIAQRDITREKKPTFTHII